MKTSLKKLHNDTLDEVSRMNDEINRLIKEYSHIGDNEPTRAFINQFHKFKLKVEKEIQCREHN
jgi:hypothetical protein